MSRETRTQPYPEGTEPSDYIINQSLHMTDRDTQIQEDMVRIMSAEPAIKAIRAYMPKPRSGLFSRKASLEDYRDLFEAAGLADENLQAVLENSRREVQTMERQLKDYACNIKIEKLAEYCFHKAFLDKLKDLGI